MCEQAQNQNAYKTEKEHFSDSRKLLKNLFSQKTAGTFCDVKLQLQGTELWAHACVLASSSIYFSERFQKDCEQESSKQSHWCFKNPLVINLDEVTNDITELCLMCVSKVIDFIYLRELAVLHDHLNHFGKIVNFLNIPDLFPLCRKYSIKTQSFVNRSDKTSNAILQESSCEILKNEVKENQRISNLLCSKITPKINKMVNGNMENVFSGKRKFDSSCISDSCTKLVVSKRTCEWKTSSESNKKCEFLCCNPDHNDTLSYASKQRKKRRMICELCSFSSVSVDKILKHIESTNHFGTMCPVCNMKIESGLTSHLKKHCDSKPYFCHICNKRNRYWDYHKVHLKVHCRNKQFFCEMCQKSFKRQQNLKDHLSSHVRNYLCNSCDYATSEQQLFKLHLFEHTQANLENIVIENESQPCKIEKQFHCQICDERFTKKRNLVRHTQIKHFIGMELKCQFCSYIAKRTDVLRHHMKKKHNFIAENKKIKSLKKSQVEKKESTDRPIVGVLIPVQLVSTDNNSSVSAYAVKKRDNLLNNEEESNNNSNQKHVLFSNLSLNSNSEIDQEPQSSFNQLPIDREKAEHIRAHAETPHPLSNTMTTSQYDVGTCEKSQSDRNCSKDCTNEEVSFLESEIKTLQRNTSSEFPNFSNNIHVREPTNIEFSDPLESNNLHVNLQKDCNDITKTEDSSNYINNDEIWLNEATGEFLSVNQFVNIHLHKAERISESSSHLSTVKENSSVDFGDSLKTLILNETTGELTVLELDDIDEIQSNPQTPQTKIVELDDSDNNLFSWNQLDNSFYSTWVLNEATGELNMVSFISMQPISKTDLKVDENNEDSTTANDDDVALFLNEGTGDLSTIYFNPNGPESNIVSEQQLIEKHSQENLETLSEHSNDDNDWLNEEFFMASAGFMAHEENETFLNELTGEFDIADFNTFQREVQEAEATWESYLNEETGEISWNTLGHNAGSGLFESDENINYGNDNCDEQYETFLEEMDDFSSKLCLDASCPSDWQTFDDNYDTMLNECTGELIKKT